MTAFAVLKSRLFTMFQTISWDIQELNIVVQLSWIMITWLVTHHIVWIGICILYSIFNNYKISWDILLKKKMFSPQNPGRGWTTWFQVAPYLGNLRQLRSFFYTKYQPQTWVQVVPHLGNEEIQTSSSRTCTWFQHEETSNHQGRERNSTSKSFIVIGDKAILLKSLVYLRKYFPSIQLLSRPHMLLVKIE